MERGGQPGLFGPGLLVRRLRALGLSDARRVEVHENRSVMVSLTAADVLRVHGGYAFAPDSVLSAIIAFTDPDTDRRTQREAKRILLDFPAYGFIRPAKRSRPPRARARKEDLPVIAELEQRHAALNARHFGNELGQVKFRVSRRMRSKLGELALRDHDDRPAEIAISRRHLVSDGWEEVERTLLHEMVHQWQAENGLAVDHGPVFRSKARELGAPPQAERVVERRVRARVGGA